MLLTHKRVALLLATSLALALSACQSDTSNEAPSEDVTLQSTVSSESEDPAAAAPSASATASVTMSWSVDSVSKNNHFSGSLSCDKAPTVGDFQNCQLFLTQSDKPVSGALLAIDGGMRAHGHGLPTQPRLIELTEQAGHYKIDGLKFSMTGDWTIGFLVRANRVNDQLIFDFTL
ncbi:hypothetical protein EOL70_01060 [Leucothrix sargassi]|nr:hypothetical protein EOL70_01060 [Leucothrix sargassi]